MKSKWNLFVSVFQLIVGAAAMVSFAVLGFGGEPVAKWIVTLILSIAFVVLGIIGIKDYTANK